MNPLDDQKQPYALNRGEGWTYRFSIDFCVKAGEINTGNGAAILEYMTRKGEEPEPHTHLTEDEMFYVLDGSITFECGDQTFELEKGGFIFLPHGIQHGYTIRGDETVRLLTVTAPFRETAADGWGGFVADMETGQGG